MSLQILARDGDAVLMSQTVICFHCFLYKTHSSRWEVLIPWISPAETQTLSGLVWARFVWTLKIVVCVPPKITCYQVGDGLGVSGFKFGPDRPIGGCAASI